MNMNIQNPVSLFNRARQSGLFHKLANRILKSDQPLLDLDEVVGRRAYSQHYGGLKSVDINLIRGTLGRKGLDFDHHFHPLTDRIRDRWVSVAKAREENVSLDVLRLIQIGGSYFVVDGHHRISVARALGESAVDAEVTVIDVE